MSLTSCCDAPSSQVQERLSITQNRKAEEDLLGLKHGDRLRHVTGGLPLVRGRNQLHVVFDSQQPTESKNCFSGGQTSAEDSRQGATGAAEKGALSRHAVQTRQVRDTSDSSSC